MPSGSSSQALGQQTADLGFSSSSITNDWGSYGLPAKAQMAEEMEQLPHPEGQDKLGRELGLPRWQFQQQPPPCTVAAGIIILQRKRRSADLSKTAKLSGGDRTRSLEALPIFSTTTQPFGDRNLTYLFPHNQGGHSLERQCAFPRIHSQEATRQGQNLPTAPRCYLGLSFPSAHLQ